MIYSQFFLIFIRFLKFQDKRLTGMAMRAMVWMRHSTRPIHPKHLFDDKRNLFLSSIMKPNIIFLDVGSGSGSECLNALNLGADMVYGVEYNSKSVELSNERLAPYKGKYQIFSIDLEEAKIPLENASVDLISFSNVLEHLHNRQGVLMELCRILKPDGKMYISIPNTNTPWKMMQRKYGVDSRDDEDHKIEYSPETLQQEMKMAGLEIVSQLYPIVPSLPINGLIALTAVLSPRFYRFLQNWKHDFAQKHPKHSIGWYFMVEPL
jgi:SAM-dependent methyltransferase